MANPFKTPEFHELFQHWNQVLAEEGFHDIEDHGLPEAALKKWHNLRWKREPEKVQEARRYYEMASDLLYDFEFRNETHRRIWELHCEGLSIRKIARAINRKNFAKYTVHTVIQEIQRKSGIKK